MKKLICLLLIIAVHANNAQAEPIWPWPTSEIKMHENKVEYLTSKKGDSYYQISKRTGLKLRQLHLYNEAFPNQDCLTPGSIIYLAPRRHHSHCKKEMVLNKPMTIREIAQQEAIKLKPLMRRNHVSSPDEQLPRGEKVFLR